MNAYKQTSTVKEITSALIRPTIFGPQKTLLNDITAYIGKALIKASSSSAQKKVKTESRVVYVHMDKEYKETSVDECATTGKVRVDIACVDNHNDYDAKLYDPIVVLSSGHIWFYDELNKLMNPYEYKEGDNTQWYSIGDDYMAGIEYDFCEGEYHYFRAGTKVGPFKCNPKTISTQENIMVCPFIITVKEKPKKAEDEFKEAIEFDDINEDF
jgi:uncharacterized protein YqkB